MRKLKNWQKRWGRGVRLIVIGPLRPFTKQVKNDKEKQWKKFEADVWKIFFGLTFNRMESYHPEHKLVYYKFLKNLFLWRT